MADTLPFVSLSAVTSTGVGSSKDYEGSFQHWTMLVKFTGSPSTGYVALQASHDGSYWVDVSSVDLANAWTVGSDKIGTVDVQQGSLWRYFRANLTTLTGGSSPTVTASIAVV